MAGNLITSELDPSATDFDLDFKKSFEARLKVAKDLTYGLSKVGLDPNKPEAIWAIKTIVGFPDSDKVEIPSEVLVQQAVQLATCYENFGTNRELMSILAERAARVYTETRGLEQYKSGVGPRARGFVFEAISERMKIGSGDIIGGRTLEARARACSQKNPLELGMKKSEIVGQLLREEIRGHVARLNFGKEVYVYLPHEDQRGLIHSQKKETGALIFRFDTNERKWIVEKGAIPSGKEQEIDKILEFANERNEYWNKNLTTPDAVLVSGTGEIRGAVEAKCWQEPEFLALLEWLEDQAGSEEMRLKLGGTFSVGGRELNLNLNLPQELRFIGEWARLNRQEMKMPVSVLRLTRNISDEQTNRLNALMLARGFPLLIERLGFTADEIEHIALSLIKTPEFALAMESEYRGIDTSSRREAIPLLERNLRARALALGIRDLGELEGEDLVIHLRADDSVADFIRGIIREENVLNAQDYGRTTRSRFSLLKKLVLDYQAYKIYKAEKNKVRLTS